MRFIDLTGYTSPDFAIQAAIKNNELKRLDPENNDNYKAYLDLPANTVWNLLKSDFENLSKKKCWYTEAFASISDFQIDHFRPKKRVSLIKPKYRYNEARKKACKKGYWWLSYELTNYRLSGGKPNNLKRNYFPLKSNSPIATHSNNSWTREIPMLLDPCNKNDPSLLSFSGTIPRPSIIDINSNDHIRAGISIKVYDLESRKLKEPRSEIYEMIKNIVEQADGNWVAINNYKDVNKDAHAMALQNFSNNCSNLISYLAPEKQFTRMVRCYYESLTNEWILDNVLKEAEALSYV